MIGRPRWVRWTPLGATVAILAALPAFGGRETQQPDRAPPLAVRVEYGDSLWTIAREYGDPNRDVREVVAEIRRTNGADPGNLRPGSTIVIPAECLPQAPDAGRRRGVIQGILAWRS